MTEFLGSSQTFLGTLMTVVLLFVFIDKSNKNSNLILYVLSEVKEEAESKVKDAISAFYEKKLKSIDSELQLMQNKDAKDIDVETTKLITEAKKEYEELYVKEKEELAKVETVTNKIVSAKELSAIPLYCFLFCIAIFIYDEMLCSDIITCTYYLLTSLIFFISISCYVVIWQWVNNVSRFYYKLNGEEIPNKGLFKIFDIKGHVAPLVVSFKSFIFILGWSLLMPLLYDKGLYLLFPPTTYTTPDYFKIFIFGFILINSFVLPLLIPSLEYHMYLIHTKKELNNK